MSDFHIREQLQVQRGAIKPKEIGYDVFTISLDTLHLISRNLLVLPLFPFLDAKTIII